MGERREAILFSEGPVTSSRWAGAALHKYCMSSHETFSVGAVILSDLIT